MSVLGKVKELFGQTVAKANPAYRGILQLGLTDRAVWTNHTYSALARAGYQVNADVYSCVNHITRAIKGIDWLVYDGPKKKKLIEDGPLVDLLRQPNPMQGTAEFKEAMTGYLMITGNTYTYRAMSGKRVVELWPLRPDRMNVKKGNWTEPIAGYEYRVGHDAQTFSPDRYGQTVMHTKLFNPLDDWRGLSPLQNAARSVDQSNDIQAWNVALMQNAACPPGAFVVESELDPTQREELRREIEEKFSGTANARRPLLLDGGLDWKQIGLNPTDLDWLAGDERCSRKICSVFGVPPELLGIMSKGGLNDANFTQARLKFYMETALPLLDHILDDLNRFLYPMFGQWIAYDPDDIEAIQADREVMHERARKNVAGSLMTIDEGRHLIGLPPLENGLGKATLIPSQCRILGEDPPEANPDKPRKPGDNGTLAARKFSMSIEETLKLLEGDQA